MPNPDSAICLFIVLYVHECSWIVCDSLCLSTFYTHVFVGVDSGELELMSVTPEQVLLSESIYSLCRLFYHHSKDVHNNPSK